MAGRPGMLSHRARWARPKSWKKKVGNGAEFPGYGFGPSWNFRVEFNRGECIANG